MLFGGGDETKEKRVALNIPSVHQTDVEIVTVLSTITSHFTDSFNLAEDMVKFKMIPFYAGNVSVLWKNFKVE